MAVRTSRRVEIPEREQIEERAHNCATDGPPHNFEAAWAAPARDKMTEESIPAIYCTACGEIRPFAIPVDAA
jgi:hypothetical protein